MEPRSLLVFLVAASLVIPVAVAQDDTAAEPDAPEDGATEDPSDGCHESEGRACEAGAGHGDEHPPEEACYQDESGDRVCEEDPGAGPHDAPPPDGHAASAHEEEAPCRPHPDEPQAMICRPPPSCEGKLYETHACTPPPECEDNGDGTFTCRMPAEAADRHRQPSDASAREHHDQRRQELRSSMLAEVADAMRSFRSTLEDLRSEYREGKAQLEQRYEEGKDELRADYRACLEAIPDDAPRSEQLGEKLPCKEDARESLRELRNQLLAERNLLREDLLGQAEDAHFRTCSALDETLHRLMVDAGAFNADLGDVLSPEDLALCSGILLDLGSSQAAEGSDWFSSGFGGGGDR